MQSSRLRTRPAAPAGIGCPARTAGWALDVDAVERSPVRCRADRNATFMLVPRGRLLDIERRTARCSPTTTGLDRLGRTVERGRRGWSGRLSRLPRKSKDHEAPEHSIWTYGRWPRREAVRLHQALFGGPLVLTGPSAATVHVSPTPRDCVRFHGRVHPANLNLCSIPS